MQSIFRMVFCKLSPPCYLEFFDKEGAVSPSLHRLDLSFKGHIPSLILVPYNNVLLCLVTGYGTGDCKSILYSCDREVISRLSWTPLSSQRKRLKKSITNRTYVHSSSRILFCSYLSTCLVPDMSVSVSDRCQFRLIKKLSISAMITFVYV